MEVFELLFIKMAVGNSYKFICSLINFIMRFTPNLAATSPMNFPVCLRIKSVFSLFPFLASDVAATIRSFSNFRGRFG
ncbi:MAG TPA: hypothetical protein DDW65_17405 [Firmicutes bacterium]|nr:hypothetical protein [Bacillota bacterium]